MLFLLIRIQHKFRGLATQLGSSPLLAKMSANQCATFPPFW